MEIPAGPEAMTEQFLTQRLRKSGVLHSASVVSLDYHPVGGGLTGRIFRMQLTYDVMETGAPASVIAKFPPVDAETRQALHDSNLFAPEIDFYLHLAGGVNLRVPRCYYCSIDDHTGEHILLLEDLGPGRARNRIPGCTADEALVSVEAIAVFHARWWNRVAESPTEIAVSAVGRIRDWFLDFWDDSLPAFVDDLPADIVKTGSVFGNCVAALVDDFSAPDTVLHGDFRAENLIFPPANSVVAPAIIDWQQMAHGPGPYDVAVLAGGNLQSDVRRKYEQKILRAYHESLKANGVDDYSFDACLHDYRLSMLFDCCRHILVSGIPYLQERTQAYREHLEIVRRFHQAVEELDALEFLPTQKP